MSGEGVIAQAAAVAAAPVRSALARNRHIVSLSFFLMVNIGRRTLLDPRRRFTESDYDAFIRRVASNPTARNVKLADLRDDSDISRIAEPAEKDWKRIDTTAGGQAGRPGST